MEKGGHTMFEPKYKLGQKVFTKAFESKGKPFLIEITSIKIGEEDKIIYNDYFEENDLFIATPIGDKKCSSFKCSNCPLNAINCTMTLDDISLRSTYNNWSKETGYRIVELERLLDSPDNE